MSRPQASRTVRWAAGAVAAVALLAGCGYQETALPRTTSADAPAPAPVQEQDCASPTASYRPSQADPGRIGSTTLDRIRKRGYLKVGVSADTYLLGARNPFTGGIEGFDIDIATAVGTAIFGDRPRIQFSVLSAADRIAALQDGSVDIVVRNMTITCDRWQEIAFSAEYYSAGQKVLLQRENADPAGEPRVGSLADLRVCAPEGTTSYANARERFPEAELIGAGTHTECLVKFQNSEVDAITGDDTVLAGLAAQDPYAVVPKSQDAFTEEPYGIGMKQGDEKFVQFVNAVLEQMRTSGAWQRSYDRWLKPYLGAGEGQPQPVYGRS